MKKHARHGNLAAVLKRHDITYAELGEGIGKSISAISFIINGDVDYKLSVAKKILAYVEAHAGVKYSYNDIID